MSVGGIDLAEPPSFVLCDEANLDAFGLWYETKGHERALTPVEAVQTPAIVAKDFRTMLRLVKQLKFENNLMDDEDMNADF